MTHSHLWSIVEESTMNHARVGICARCYESQLFPPGRLLTETEQSDLYPESTQAMTLAEYREFRDAVAPFQSRNPREQTLIGG